MVNSENASTPRGAEATILVVDDETDILEAVKATLEAYLPDCEILTADSGANALHLLEEHKVHVILTDFRMPGMDGLEFLASAAPLAPHAVRIMITAYPDLDLAIRALNEQHVLNFVTKPVDPERLVKVVTEAIQVRKDKVAQAQTIASALEDIRHVKAAHAS